ncbi:MAG TPA: alpha/beta fold hydrolase [Terriglobia bacterium]|nr:alpha/beta fold hydrolase [Terriglobia bacterium]
MVDQDGLTGLFGQLPGFFPKFPWFGGDLQTLRNVLRPPRASLTAWPGQPIAFDTADGTGDRLLAELHQPAEASRPLPLVILVHGLTGSMDSSYIRVSAMHLLRAGYPVLRLNLRGAGPSRGLTRGFYHAGRSDDLHQVIGQLDGRLAGNGIALVGFSLGGNVVLKYLAERGQLAPIMAAVSISAPIDLAATQREIGRRRNRRYHDFLLKEMKVERPCPSGIDRIVDFDDQVVAPANGFADAADYYRQSSAKPLLPAIRRPTLLIHAANDPWIPGHIYRDIDPASNRRLRLLLPRSGGHVGFHGIGLDRPWHDLAIARFLEFAARGQI